MSMTYKGGYYLEIPYSTLLVDGESHSNETVDMRYYVEQGVQDSEADDDSSPVSPAVLVFDSWTDKLVYAKSVFDPTEIYGEIKQMVQNLNLHLGPAREIEYRSKILVIANNNISDGKKLDCVITEAVRKAFKCDAREDSDFEILFADALYAYESVHEDSEDDKETFFVSINVSGNYIAEVKAEKGNFDEAKKLAEQAFSNADFGELSDIEGDVYCIDDEYGDRVWEED